MIARALRGRLKRKWQILEYEEHLYGLFKKRKRLSQSTVRKKMATDTFTYNALRAKALKERIKTQRNIVSPSNSTRAMLLV